MANFTPEELKRYKKIIEDQNQYYIDKQQDSFKNSSELIEYEPLVADTNNPKHIDAIKKAKEIGNELDRAHLALYGTVEGGGTPELNKAKMKELFPEKFKKQPLIIEPIKEEKEKPIQQEGFSFPSRNKLMKMEGEEEAPPTESILDKLLKKERESSPDVQVRKQVWNPDLSTFELSKETETKRPFTDKLFGSPEIRAAEKVEQYSRLKQEDEERAKQLDSSGRRMITKNPLLESYEKLLQIKPEESRQIASASEAPVNDGGPVVPEIKSVKEQKSSPVSKSSVSTGIGEDDSPEAKLNEAIKAESEKAQKPEMDFNEMLRMAQEARDKGVLLGNIGKAAETFATGLTGTVKGGVVTKPVSTDFYDKLIKQAGQPIEDVGDAYTMKTKQDEMQRLARRRDPGSEESKFARDLLSQQGIKVPEAATADALEKYAPQLTNILNQREAREQRSFLAQQAREARIDKDSEKEKDAIQELTHSFRKELNTGEIGKLGTYARKANSGIKLMEETIKNPSGYKDFAATFALLKATQGDDSVIREAEMKLGLSLGSLPEKTKAKFIQFFTGEMRTPALRKEMLDAMKLLAKRANDQYLSAADATLHNAEQYGIPKRLLIGQEFSESSVENKDKNQLELPKDKKYIPGSRITTKKGSYIVDPSGLTATEE